MSAQRLSVHEIMAAEALKRKEHAADDGAIWRSAMFLPLVHAILAHWDQELCGSSINSSLTSLCNTMRGGHARCS